MGSAPILRTVESGAVTGVRMRKVTVDVRRRTRVASHVDGRHDEKAPEPALSHPSFLGSNPTSPTLTVLYSTTLQTSIRMGYDKTGTTFSYLPTTSSELQSASSPLPELCTRPVHSAMSSRRRYRDLWMTYIAQSYIPTGPAELPSIDYEPTVRDRVCFLEFH